ncbi:MAG: CorA family divalent cation transporter [Clostridium sp.]|nr:CorA family divalent cation transporter [Clostridium sp.]
MYILNIDTREKYTKFCKEFYNKEDSFLIVSTVKELKLLKRLLDIEQDLFKQCLNFNEDIKLDLFDNYDLLSVNSFEVENEDIFVEEINIFLADNFILVVCNESNFIYDTVKDIIMNNISMTEEISIVVLFKLNYLIFKSIITHQFESLEKLEDLILKLEDEMIEEAKKEHLSKINDLRCMTRTVVKNIRPLLYIEDRIVKENIRYLKYSDVKKYNLDNLQGIDLGIDKLYNFAISTRELADKLLDVYASKVSEKTNNLITKLTILTGISLPITIITGIYGMNFRVMPWLNYEYAYPITLGVMVLILIVGIVILKVKDIL